MIQGYVNSRINDPLHYLCCGKKKKKKFRAVFWGILFFLPPNQILDQSNNYDINEFQNHSPKLEA